MLKPLVDGVHARVLLLRNAVVLVLPLGMRMPENNDDDAVQHSVFLTMVSFRRELPRVAETVVDVHIRVELVHGLEQDLGISVSRRPYLIRRVGRLDEFGVLVRSLNEEQHVERLQENERGGST